MPIESSPRPDPLSLNGPSEYKTANRMPASPNPRIIIPLSANSTTPISMAKAISPMPRRVIDAMLRMPIWMKRDPPV